MDRMTDTTDNITFPQTTYAFGKFDKVLLAKLILLQYFHGLQQDTYKRRTSKLIAVLVSLRFFFFAQVPTHQNFKSFEKKL